MPRIAVALILTAILITSLASCTQESAYRPAPLTVAALTPQDLPATPAGTVVSSFAVGVAEPTAVIIKIVEATHTPTPTSTSTQGVSQVASQSIQSATVSASAATATAEVQAQGLPGAPGSGPPGLPGRIYIVRTGDTLYSIARRFGVTVEELAAVNGIFDVRRIGVGDALLIPSRPIPPGAPGWFYVVQPGDTLYSISRRVGVPLEAIAAVNGIFDVRRIWVGQKLLIPSPGPAPDFPSPPHQANPPWLPGPGPWPSTTPWPSVTPTPVSTVPGPAPSTHQLYTSTEGKFSIHYPQPWHTGSDTPGGYILFWARETDDPFSTGFAVASTASSGWRPSREVLDDFKAALPGLFGAVMAGASFTWDNNIVPVTLGGQLAVEDYGYVQSGGTNRDRLRAQAVFVGSRDYLVLVWAPTTLWSSEQPQLDSLIATLSFLP